MYHDEIHHLGRPHFHARYADDEASIEIETMAVIAGELPAEPRDSLSNGAANTKRSCSKTGLWLDSTNRCARSIC